MMNSDKRDDLQDYLAGNDDLSAQYEKSKAGVAPPVEVDDAILRAAHAHAERPKAKVLLFPRAWMAPLAAAATLVLVVGVSQWFGGPVEKHKAIVAEKPARPAVGSVEPGDSRDSVSRPVSRELQQTAPASLDTKQLPPVSSAPGAKQGRSAELTAGNDAGKAATIAGGSGARAPLALHKIEGAQRQQSAGIEQRAQLSAEQRKKADLFSDRSLTERVAGQRHTPRVQAKVLEQNEKKIVTAERSEMTAKPSVSSREAEGAAAASQSPASVVARTEQDTRSWAARLNIPYRDLPAALRGQRLQLTQTQWLHEIRKLIDRGERAQAQAELAAFAALHGADDAQVKQLAKELASAPPAAK